MIKYFSNFKIINKNFKYIINMEQSIYINSSQQHNYHSLNGNNNKLDCKNLYLYEHLKPQKVLHQISITQKEKEIFEIIKSVLKKNSKNTVCRVAGGWVRDKLLGKNSDDIDIALDDMKGGELAKMINSELYPGQDKYGIVEKNSEKSKHLETATMIISGTSVDFVNLRSEKYTETSRVPIVDIGTPQEDAMRRDITINSMFYNINEDRVEDFLGKGLEDLTNGYIRTPINPVDTFTDDPLRILRVIRFAVRFQFDMDPAIENSTILPEIKAALYQKISNERIAKELSLMLDGNKPQCAIYLIYKYKMLDAVMKLPISIYGSNNDASYMATEEEKRDLNTSVNLTIVGSFLLKKLSNNPNRNTNFFLSDYFDPSINPSKKIFFLSLMTLPFLKYSVKINKEILKADAYIIRESLKLSNEYVRDISVLSENLQILVDYLELGEFDRLSSAKLVRKIKSNYLHKLTAVSICYEYLMKVFPLENNLVEYLDTEIFDKICLKYERWYKYLEKENLTKVDELEPLLKGDMIKDIFQAKGKEIGILLESLIEKQISQPDLTKDEAISFLHKKREEFSDSIQKVENKTNKANKIKNKK
jgi:tRNA nucleotidyltransferase (CCA-adding enzyme)